MTRDWTVTLRIDTSAWSANREYPMMNVFGMGHAWITVTAPNGNRTDFGYYPKNGGVAGVGELRMHDVEHQPHQDAAYTYHVTADQASRILSAAERVQANPGWYDGLKHNCLTVARDLMVQGGLPMPRIVSDDGLNNAWKSGTPAVIHDPANYNAILRSTSEGKAARAEYEKSSELSGMKSDTDLHIMTHQAQAQALYETHAQLSPDESPTYPAEVGSPDSLTHATASADAAHPQLSIVDSTGMDADPGLSFDAGLMGWNGAPHADPGISYGGTWHADPAQSVNPGLSADHHVPDWVGMSHGDVGPAQPHGDAGWMPHTDPGVHFDPGNNHHS